MDDSQVVFYLLAGKTPEAGRNLCVCVHICKVFMIKILFPRSK